jgi:pyruvate/2-oxoglutarate dehydrogenase complex dihydrolipoamide dehydrogenase (E3) component
MAEAFGRLGAEVTLIEAAAQVRPREEPVVAWIVANALADFGVTVRTAEWLPDGLARKSEFHPRLERSRVAFVDGPHDFKEWETRQRPRHAPH